MRPPALFIVFAGALLASPAILTAYREGPLPAMTGGFGEQTCRTCHFDNAANGEGGSLRIEGVPDAYTPGREYAITIEILRPETKRGGFEMAARFAEGPLKGQQSGMLRAVGDRTQIVRAPGSDVQYVQHTKAGSELASVGRGRWTVHWTAPDGALAAVIFNIAANASNDDASPLGDFIYTAARTSRPPLRFESFPTGSSGEGKK